MTTNKQVRPLRVGLIGCGVISDIYLKTSKRFDIIDIVACASLNIEESRAKAQQYDIAKVCTPEEIIQDPNIRCCAQPDDSRCARRDFTGSGSCRKTRLL